ncbi:hypothetical protein OAH18_00040 [bacterium]|nr:hypothetical protein [bacterium]
MFGIPCRVHPAFWVMGAVMGYSPGWAAALGINVMAVVFLWWIVIFVSILIHELGHALMAEYFGWPSNILLYHFGGLAFYQPIRGRTAAKNIAVAFAGPGAGFILYGLTLGFEQMAFDNDWFVGNRIYAYMITQMKYLNLWWGLVNLLPVLPLDGGRICQEILGLTKLRNSDVVSVKIGIVVAGAVAAYVLTTSDQRYVGFLFLFLAVNNYQSLQQRGSRW